MKLSHCSLNNYDADWWHAVQKCREEGKVLLCYKSKEEVQKIVDFFFIHIHGNMSLKFWLSSRTCSSLDQLNECLSVHIDQNATKVWHYFQQTCDPLPFICCNLDDEPSTTRVTAAEFTTEQSMSEGGTSASVNLTEFENATVISPTSIEHITETSVVVDTFSSTQNKTSSNIETTVGIITEASTTETVLFSSAINRPSSSDKTTVEVKTTSVSLWCRSVKKRGILWPDTPFGMKVILSCPGDSTGNATWLCSSLGNWATPNPDMSQCHSMQLKAIKDTFENMPSDETISALTDLFEKQPEVLQGNDLQDAMQLISLLPDKLFQETASLTETMRWQTASNSVAKTIFMFNQMMDLDTWVDISEEKVPRVGSQMLSAADHFGFFLADTMKNKAHHSILNANIALEVLKQEYGQSVTLPMDFGEHRKHGRITLNTGYDEFLGPNGGPISIVYVYYANMSNILLSKSTGLLNSPVVSTSIFQGELKPIIINNQVHVLVEHLYADKNDTACVFWNLKQHEWDPTGCHVKITNSTHTLCECDHLTNFAVLMDYKGVLVDLDDTVLFYITVIGCSISIVSLAICVAVFACYRWQRRNSWGVRYSIHRNLCLTLLLANILLIAGLNQTKNHVICAVIAGFLHYLFLSAFSWMLLEGLHIYILLVIVFASKKTHWKKYYVFGYGFPLLVVSITAAVRPQSYGTEDICWLSVDKGAVWSFTGPVACILLVNSAALLLAQVKASKISAKDDNIAVIKRWLRVTFILFPILGLTWVLGFLYVGKKFEVVAYIFAILNSLQGFCIFICHCIMDKNAWSMVMNSIRKRRTLVETESSGTNKRSRKEMNRGLLNARNRLSSASSGQKKWHWWRKPWAFCFTLKLVPNVEVQPSSSDSDEVATVLKWRKLHESSPL